MYKHTTEIYYTKHVDLIVYARRQGLRFWFTNNTNYTGI